MRTLSAFLLFSVLLTFQNCQQSPETPKKEKKESKPRVQAPDFNADSAYALVKKQVDFGPRVPNSQRHQLCGDFLVEYLEELKGNKLPIEVYEQEFQVEAYDGTLLNARNIVGSVNPAARKRILLAAHWDTRPFADQGPEETHYDAILGANDGASGVGVLLEIARVLTTTDSVPLNVGVDVLLFDVEDYGAPSFANSDAMYGGYCLGSQYWASNPHKDGYHAYYGILLDMVGAKNARFTWEAHSKQYAPKILKMVWDTAQEIGYGQFFERRETDPIMDDHVFVNTEAGIPMIDIIHHDSSNDNIFFEHWHTLNDNMEAIDKNTLKAVGQTLLQVIYNE